MKWKLYDELLEQIPHSILVQDVLQKNWWLVKTNQSVGIAMYYEQGVGIEKTLPKEIVSLTLRDLAEYIRSWNFYEATLGLAAINAYYNTKEKIELLQPIYAKDENDTIFSNYKSEIVGKKVGVIGHFPFLEEIGEICTLSIFEKNPQKGDYPDSAAEYLLGEQDYVFITGTTISNKTLPRLLQLCQNAKIILVGPSVPLTPIWFKYGIDVLGGSVAWDFELLWETVSKGYCRGIFEKGAKMLRIEKER